MEITWRALVTSIHGMLFGAFFLMAVYGLVIELIRTAYAKQQSEPTPQGRSLEHVYIVAMIVLGWVAVLTGTYVIYPWYRAVPPAGTTNLMQYPRYLLVSSPTTSGWHNLGMEWKEHVAWIATIAMTMVGYLFTKHKLTLRNNPQVRTAVLLFALVAFGSAGIAGFFGAMLNKYAPVNGGGTIHLMEKSQ